MIRITLLYNVKSGVLYTDINKMDYTVNYNQSTEELTGVDFVDVYFFYINDMFFCMTCTCRF